MTNRPRDTKFQLVNVSRDCVALTDAPTELPSQMTAITILRAQQRLWRQMGGRAYVARRLGIKGASLGHSRQGVEGIPPKYFAVICTIAREVERRTGKTVPIPLGLFGVVQQAATHEQARTPATYRASRTPEQLAVIAARRDKGLRAKATAERNGTARNLDSQFYKTFSTEELNKAGLGPKNLKALARAGLAVEMKGNLPKPVSGLENGSMGPIKGGRKIVTLRDERIIKFTD